MITSLSHKKEPNQKTAKFNRKTILTIVNWTTHKTHANKIISVINKIRGREKETHTVSSVKNRKIRKQSSYWCSFLNNNKNVEHFKSTANDELAFKHRTLGFSHILYASTRGARHNHWGKCAILCVYKHTDIHTHARTQHTSIPLLCIISALSSHQRARMPSIVR